MTIKRIAILGATGSIGVSALEVIAAHPERFQVVAMAAGANHSRLIQQARRFRPKLVAMANPESHAIVARELAGSGIQVLDGPQGIRAVATHPEVDLVLSAMVGIVGLEPTLAAIAAGKDLALANKECLVTAGALIMDQVARHGVRLLPVDSEHSAIFQVLDPGQPLRRLILTASGGPFRGWNLEALAQVTPEQALAHPNWTMGRKVTIDSATLLNKGLEVIEASWLFGIEGERIQVVVHPESIVHSLVEYVDGSVLAQMGVPDMRTPIAVALAWPDRVTLATPPLDLPALGSLTFQEPDLTSFPGLELAYRALRQGDAAAVVLNAADEVAVAAFLAHAIRFTHIPELIAWTMDQVQAPMPTTIAAILRIDLAARRQANLWIERYHSHPAASGEGRNP